MTHIYYVKKTRATSNDSTCSDYDMMQSMLKSINELMLPVDIVDGLIAMIKESIAVNAGLVGNMACDVLENIAKDDASFDFIVDKSEDYIKLVDMISYLKYLEEYKRAVIRAGGK